MAALAALVLATAATPAPAVTVRLGATTNAASVELAVGQRLDVRLAANPTTGYRWTATLRGAVLAANGSPAYVPAGSGLLGAGGTDVFSYRAVAPGTAHLAFAYARSWEHAAPAQRAALTVVVRAAKAG
jgi:inhibitor of cysteine peptidase